MPRSVLHGQRRAANRPPMLDCAQTCSSTLDYCLQQGGGHATAFPVKAIIDCVEACHLAASFHARNSELADQAMAFCAKACKACEESCEEFGDDPTMRRCATVCRECYEHCAA